jgi:hypothetical protein
MDIALKVSDLRRALGNLGPREPFEAIDEIGLPHHIRRLDPQPPKVANCDKCLPSALGLAWQPEFHKLVSSSGVWAGWRFVHWLTAHGHLQQLPGIFKGRLVLYFHGPGWKHAGIGQDDGTVISKWGEWLLLRHPVDEVPSRDGNIVRAYRHPGPKAAMRLFRRFVQDCETRPEWAHPRLHDMDDGMPSQDTIERVKRAVLSGVVPRLNVS